jgi:putative copper resistance protein D
MSGARGFTVHGALTLWQFSPFALSVTFALVGLAIWYLRADWRLAARGRRWSGWRTLSFMLGLVMVDLALQSPLVAYTGEYFEAHVLQHLLLMVVGPPLLALGAPSTLLLQTSSRATKARWLRLLKSRPFAVLSHPVTVFLLYYASMFAFFLTPLLNYSMLHMWLMDLINLGFLVGATLFWWPMVGIDPIIHWKQSHPARMGNILLGSGIEAFLGVAILNARHGLASMYSLSSTHVGGGILWAATEIVTLGAFIPIFYQWMRSEARVAARADSTGGTPITLEPAKVVQPPAGSGGASGAAAGRKRVAVSVPTERLTAWEYAWMSRTGTVPTRFVAPDHAPEPGEE